MLCCCARRFYPLFFFLGAQLNLEGKPILRSCRSAIGLLSGTTLVTGAGVLVWALALAAVPVLWFVFWSRLRLSSKTWTLGLGLHLKYVGGGKSDCVANLG